MAVFGVRHLVAGDAVKGTFQADGAAKVVDLGGGDRFVGWLAH